MSNKKKDDEAGVFLVRLLNFMTEVANNPSVVLNDLPEYRALVAGFGLLTNDPELKENLPESQGKPVDLAEFFRLLGQRVSELQTRGLVRLQVAKTEQDISAAKADLEEASMMFQMLGNLIKLQNKDAMKTMGAMN